MTIQFNPLANTSEREQNFISEKVEKLSTFYERIERATVTLKDHETHGTNKKEVQIRLSIPGPDLFAEARSDSFEKALDEVISKLTRQLKKHKEKLKSH